MKVDYIWKMESYSQDKKFFREYQGLVHWCAIIHKWTLNKLFIRLKRVTVWRVAAPVPYIFCIWFIPYCIFYATVFINSVFRLLCLIILYQGLMMYVLSVFWNKTLLYIYVREMTYTRGATSLMSRPVLGQVLQTLFMQQNIWSSVTTPLCSIYKLARRWPRPFRPPAAHASIWQAEWTFVHLTLCF